MKKFYIISGHGLHIIQVYTLMICKPLNMLMLNDNNLILDL